MRKYLIIGLLFFSVIAQGQIGRFPIYTAPVVVAAGCVGNMVSNGEFADGSDWTANSGWTISGGVATNNDAVSGSKLIQASADMLGELFANTNYTISFDITISSGNANINIQSAASESNYLTFTDFANGHHSVDITTPGWIGSKGICFNVNTTDTDNAFTIDNICVVTR